MGWLDALDSFANGTLIDDTFSSLERSIEQFEKLVGSGEEALQSVVDVADTAVQKVESSTEKATQVMDVVHKKLQ